MNVTHWLVVLCTVVVVVWSIVRLIQHTSLFNLLFLFYPYVLTSSCLTNLTLLAFTSQVATLSIVVWIHVGAQAKPSEVSAS